MDYAVGGPDPVFDYAGLPATGYSSESFGQCVDACIATTYGEAYEVASDLSPLSVLSVGGNLGVSVASEWVEDSLSRTATRNLYGNRQHFNVGQRQLRTLSQLRAINNASMVLGVGAAGFQVGAQAYCRIQCY